MNWFSFCGWVRSLYWLSWTSWWACCSIIMAREFKCSKIGSGLIISFFHIFREHSPLLFDFSLKMIGIAWILVGNGWIGRENGGIVGWHQFLCFWRSFLLAWWQQPFKKNLKLKEKLGYNHGVNFATTCLKDSYFPFEIVFFMLLIWIQLFQILSYQPTHQPQQSQQPTSQPKNLFCTCLFSLFFLPIFSRSTCFLLISATLAFFHRPERHKSSAFLKIMLHYQLTKLIFLFCWFLCC